MDAPTLTSHEPNASPLGKLISTETVIGSSGGSKPCALDANVTSEGYVEFSGLIQPWCQCEPKMRPPLSANARTFVICGFGANAVLEEIVVALAGEQHDVVAVQELGVVPELVRIGQSRAVGHRHRRADPGVEMNAARAVSRSELGVLHADLAHEALERVGTASRNGDLRKMALVSISRKTRLRRIRRVVDARLDARNDDLPPPLADLHDERNLVAGRSIVDDEATVRTAQTHGDRLTRVRAIARFARRSRLEISERLIRDVDDDVVERNLAGRVVHDAADARFRAPGARIDATHELRATGRGSAAARATANHDGAAHSAGAAHSSLAATLAALRRYRISPFGRVFAEGRRCRHGTSDGEQRRKEEECRELVSHFGANPVRRAAHRAPSMRRGPSRDHEARKSGDPARGGGHREGIPRSDPFGSFAAGRSERAHELGQAVLLRAAQRVERVARRRPLSVVSANRARDVAASPIVEQLVLETDTPEWLGAHAPSDTHRIPGVADAVAESAHVVHQEVAVRVEREVTGNTNRLFAGTVDVDRRWIGRCAERGRDVASRSNPCS